MKKYIIGIISLLLLAIPYVNAAELGDNLYIFGTVIGTTDVAIGNAGKLIFPDLVSTGTGVRVTPTNKTLDTNGMIVGDMSVSGYFWSSGLYDGLNVKTGWITFDIGNVKFPNGSSVPKAKLKNNGNDTFTLTGYAWSYASGWIYFPETNLVGSDNSTKVIYTRSTGKLSGNAWSKNVGWLNFDGLNLITTPPNKDDFDDSFKVVFAANHEKIIKFNSNSHAVRAEITNYNNSSTFTHTIPSSKTITHNFQKVKDKSDYYMTLTDKFGNTGDAIKLTVVSNIPSFPTESDLTDPNYKGSTLSFNSGTLVADGESKFIYEFILRDKYGNIVKNKYLNDINNEDDKKVKDIKVSVKFINELIGDQINSNRIESNPINYLSNNFGLINHATDAGDEGFDYRSNGEYIINVASYAPSEAGYEYAIGNISLDSLLVAVSGKNGYSDVGETSELGINFTDQFGKDPLRFKPLIRIKKDALTNTSNWNIISNSETGFKSEFVYDAERATGTKSRIDTGKNKLIYLLDILYRENEMSSASKRNHFMSFQNIKNWGSSYSILADETGWNMAMDGSNNSQYNFYYLDHDAVNNPHFDEGLSINSTTVVKDIGTSTQPGSKLKDEFKTTPRIVLVGMSKYGMFIGTEFHYTIDGKGIAYKSANRSTYTTDITAGDDGLEDIDEDIVVTSSQIKVIGQMNANNENFNISQEEVFNAIGDMSKDDIFTTVRKNAQDYIKTGNNIDNLNGVMYKNDDYTLSSWPNDSINTILIKGNIVINDDIIGGNQKTIVALGGDIYITNNVQNIEATLVTDGGVQSGEGFKAYLEMKDDANYKYDDDDLLDLLNKQLYIRGSVISYNTIGGASRAFPACPFNISGGTCDLRRAKQYDFNNFRYYTLGKGVRASELEGNYIEYPMVIEYDPRIQSSPSQMLKIK